ncbi:MAG: S8 family serine peptidase [Saprospiraceae bacterium]|nr:S8 family serine peptidase [Saprospiraceae bacterium]
MKIINISWGWQSSYLDEFTINTIQNIINDAYAAGAVIVAAAGNFNETALFYPAACEHVISVASTDNNDKKSPNSNFGKWIDIAAPGHHILSTYPFGGYDWESGTSMAAPLVSGTLALMYALRPDMTPEQAEICLKAGVDPVNDYVGLIGVGRLNALEALKCLEAQVQQDNDESETTSNNVFYGFSAAPNPMDEYTLFEYKLNVASKVHLKVYNRFGVAITLLESVYQQPGYYQAKLKRGNLSAGIYYYQLQARDFVETKKLVINE